MEAVRRLLWLYIAALACLGGVGATSSLSVSSSWPKTLSTNESSDPLGKTVELYCTVPPDAVQSYSELQWLDGSLVIEGSASGRRELVANGQHNLTLTIHNFSVWDYGTYSCRCVNIYNLSELHIAEEDVETIPLSCSDPSEEIHILPGFPSEVVNASLVQSKGEEVPLSCYKGNDTATAAMAQWMRVDSAGSLQTWARDRVVVASPEDQGKFVCHSNQTVHKIEYIAIKDYLPVRFLYPPSSIPETVTALDLSRLCSDVCTAFTPYPTTSTLELYVLEGQEEKEVDNMSTLGNFSDAYDHRTWLQEGNVHTYCFEVLDGAQAVSERLKCRISNQWESQSVRFQLGSINEACPEPATTSVSAQLENGPTSTTSTTTRASWTASLTPVQPTSVTAQLDKSASPTAARPTPRLPSRSNSDGLSKAAVIGTSTGASVAALIALLLGVCVMRCVYRLKHPKRRPAKARRLSGDEMLIRSSRIGSSTWTQVNLLVTPTPAPNPTTMALSHSPAVISNQMKRCLQDIQHSEWLFPYEKLEFGEELGSGAFGVVRKAVILDICDGSSKTVAVKTLKDVASDEDEKDIISELRMLQHVGAHPNIVSLLGVSAHEGRLCVIVEYCAKGSLLSWLRARRSTAVGDILTISGELIGMARQVAVGMEFLESKNCIHRDLAARNVLITDDNEVKVADFGLARKLYTSVYRPSGGKMPLKWMAPEAILDGIYTSQSDVWSFGVLLWEIMTLGRTPYPGMSGKTLLREVEKGYRMPQPFHCPSEVYEVMTKCWQLKLCTRPTFTTLVTMLNELLQKGSFSKGYYNVSGDLISTLHDGASCPGYPCEVRPDSGLCSYCQEMGEVDIDLCTECRHYSTNDGQSPRTPSTPQSLPVDSGVSTTTPCNLQLEEKSTFPLPTSVYLELSHEPDVSSVAYHHSSTGSLCSDDLMESVEDIGDELPAEPGHHCRECATADRTVLEGYVSSPYTQSGQAFHSPPQSSEQLELNTENVLKLSVEPKDSTDSGVSTTSRYSCTSDSPTSMVDLVHYKLTTSPRTHPKHPPQCTPGIKETHI